MRRQLVAFLLALAVLALAISPRAAAPIEKPRYAAGDTWTYRTALNLTDAFGRLSLDGNTTLLAGQVFPILIQKVSVEALEVGIAGGGRFEGVVFSAAVSGNWTVTGSEHWETSSWNSVRSFVRLTAQGLFPGPPPTSFALQLRNETTRLVTTDGLGWPLNEGGSGETRAHWAIAQNVTFEAQGFPPFSANTSVNANFTTAHVQNGTARITTPAGTFETLRIEERGPEGGLRERWFSARAAANVRVYDYNQTGDRGASSELVSFRYQAGEPGPAFPWLYVLVASLAAVVLILLTVLGLRHRRRPVDVWMPPERGSGGGSP